MAGDPVPSTSTTGAEPTKSAVQELQDIQAKHHGIELLWIARYELLERHGYRLRPRFRPGWIPSWQGTDLDPFSCEDGHFHLIEPAIDAVRISDGASVMVKRVLAGTHEVEIGQYFSTPELRQDDRNHCVPFLDVFHDDEDESHDYVVEPVLRPFDWPGFYLVGEVVEFVRQTLEGLHFMHEEGVAHQDCAASNIMMDGHTLYPKGFHPSAQFMLPGGEKMASHIPRFYAAPFKYYFIDFDISVKFDKSSTEPRLTSGFFGQEKEAPELHIPEPYDPFALDVFILGKVYQKEFLNKYSNLKFLIPMVEAMTPKEPKARISVARAIEMFEEAQRNISRFALRRRLHPVEESATSRRINDLNAFLYDGAVLVKRGLGHLLFKKSAAKKGKKIS